jgi:hypothetical protein
MSESTLLVPIASDETASPAQLHSPEIAIRRKEEHLPFTISVVREDAQMEKAVSIRHAAYARHVPAFAAKLTTPEPSDRDAGSILLLAESKLDGTPVGTLRIQTNRFKPLAVEASAQLPEKFRGKSLSEATRLGISGGSVGRVAKISLFKAYYMCCLEADIEWMIVTGRPPIDRQYEALLFDDVFPGVLVDMRHVHNLPHRVLAFNIPNAQSLWASASHPLYDFMCRTHHPDIDLTGADFSRLGLTDTPSVLTGKAQLRA